MKQSYEEKNYEKIIKNKLEIYKKKNVEKKLKRKKLWRISNEEFWK